nr:glycoside hydrolase family 1 protein [uncultured Anaerostipes sp.]
MGKMISFPKDFWWGAAMSGPQMEGTKDKLHENVMDFWCRTEREDFFDGVGSEITTDFYHRYKEDIAMMKSIGMNSIRTSIQWSRLIKDLETGEPDETAVKFYSDVIEECRKNNIELVLNLHHFDLPVELLQKYGGWESKHVVDLFVKFAQTAFRLFGDKVRYWTTFNEPMVIPEAGYLCGFHYPKKVNRGKQAVQIIYNLNLASAKCIEAFHDMCNGKIGIVLNLTPAYPRSEAEEDLQASEITDLFYNRSFLDPAVHGKFPEKLTELLEENHVLWETSEEEINIIRNNTVDFLGVNYYHPKRVQAREHKLECDQWTPEQYYEEYDMPGKRINPYRGWEIYPEAVYDIAMNVKENYNNIPWYVSENGMGVEGEEKYRDAEGRIQDDYRIDFYKEHLSQLAKAMEEGSNCFGYHAWTGIDCWSWNNAYKNRYGFIGLDLKTQKRTIKKSGFWYKELSENHGFVIEEE